MSAIQDFVKTLNDKAVLVFGMGRTGLSAAKALHKAGARVVVADDSNENINKAKRLNVEILDKNTQDFSEFAMLLLSPGVPLTHPKPHWVVEKARAANVEILCDIELFHRVYPDIKTIGVTGTNGKSTTCSLIQHILIDSGAKAHLGGNIGTPVFDLKMKEDDAWVVLEISSFQIDLCPSFRPDIAVLSNLAPDHLDRHGGMDQYVDVKERLTEFSKLSEVNVAVICTDDVYTKKIYERAKDIALRDVIEVSVEKHVASGVYVEDDVLFDALNGEGREVGNLTSVATLKGKHNQQNVVCAYAALSKVGLSSEEIWRGVECFPGLNHRQFLVRTLNGVSYVNDSKSTNAASAAVAIGCRNNVYWIVGGRRKKTGIDGLEEFFPHIKHAFLIGESSEDFANWMDKYGLDYTRCITLDRAVQEANDMAQANRGQPGGAGFVLLSPACASFDQFESFEHRGDMFAELVNALEE